MEEEIKTFRFTHGRKTYRMAWIVEYCLFAIALSLAGFNIAFSIQEGDIITGLLLAVGWAILAVIELSIIPMAGSFRLAKGINKVYSGCGLLGLLFLSAFTVYEFNEIASEYMTRGARKNAITVERLENDISKLESQINAIEETSNDKKKSMASLLKAKKEALEAEQTRFEKQKEKTEQYYSSLLEESSRNNEFPIYNPEEKKRLERIDSQTSEYNQAIAGLRDRKEEILREHKLSMQEVNAPKIKLLESQIESLRESIQRDQNDKDMRVREASGGLFTSKVEKIAQIQKEIGEEISEKNSRIQAIESEVAALKAPSVKPEQATVIDSKISDIERLIQEQFQHKKEIESAANDRMDTPEFKKIIQENQNQVNRVYRDRINATTNNLEEHNKNIAAIEQKYESELQLLADNSRSDGERYEDRESLESEITEFKGAINDIVEETAQEYERTMYFRMASWFSDESSTGFGKLPKKSDYNKALRYIFAPIGIFFGLTAIVLAYLGTSFMFEESKKHDSQINVDDLEKRNAELEEKQKSFDSIKKQLDEAESSKKHAVSIATAELNSKLKETELQLTDQENLEKQIANLKIKLEQNEADLLKAKQRVFEAIRAIPQSITIIDESKD